MSDQQPIIVSSRNTTPDLSESPTSSPPCSCVSSSDWDHHIGSISDFAFPLMLQQCVDLWRGDTNPRPTSAEMRMFMRRAGDTFQHFAYLEEGLGRVLHK